VNTADYIVPNFITSAFFKRSMVKSNEFQRMVEDEQTEGWSIDEDGDERVVLAKRGYGSLGGHVLVALLTIWWTAGIGNALYAAYKYFGDADTKVIRDPNDG